MTSRISISADASNRAGTNREWASRPADQRYLNLTTLLESQTALDSVSREIDVDDATGSLVTTDGAELFLRLNTDAPVAKLTNWSTSQLAERVGMRSTIFTKLGDDGQAGAELAARILNHGIQHKLDGTARTARGWVATPPSLAAGTAPVPIMRSIMSQKYGRLTNSKVTQAIIEMNEQYGGIWKVPGALEYADGGLRMNPDVDVTTQSTTLYGSDRDMYVFLVDDRNPIEIAPGDVVYRGFVIKNSSVGDCKLVLFTFYFRGVCCNRLLWGVEGFREFEMVHFQSTPERFITEVMPTLSQFAEARTQVFLTGVAEAKRERWPTVSEAKDFMISRKLGLSVGLADRVIERVTIEEQRDVRSLWDIAQGLTSVARSITHQNKREELERSARKALDYAASAA